MFLFSNIVINMGKLIRILNFTNVNRIIRKISSFLVFLVLAIFYCDSIAIKTQFTQT